MHATTRSQLTAVAVAGAIVFSIAGAGGASATEAPHHAATSTAVPGTTRVMFPGLSTSTVTRYDRYVALGPHGVFHASIPASIARNDPRGTAAVRLAVQQANELLRAQRANPHSMSVAGDPLSYQGDHGGIKIDWSGATLWLDGEATTMLNDLLTLGATAKQVLDFLNSIGVVLPYGIGPIAGIILTGVVSLKNELDKCRGSDGFTLTATLLGQVTCTARN